MKRGIAKVFSLLALGVILFTAWLVFLGILPQKTFNLLTLVASMIWFLFAPWWMIRPSRKKANSGQSGRRNQ